MVSWFCESMLVPYVHFVPLSPDFENLKSQYEWVLRNPDESALIAENARCFAQQFLDVQRETELWRAVVCGLRRGVAGKLPAWVIGRAGVKKSRKACGTKEKGSVTPVNAR
jgi:hypothetical protein